uniref:ADAMTS like 4 n=1 Tax=Poecilia formosa TaxID=48698 RepID=A0A096MEH7_POEFO
EAEPVDGVWSVWGEWSECSQTCGVGVSHRTRKCLPPPPRNPYYPSRYPGQHPSYHSPSVSRSHNPGLPLYRNTGGEGPPVQSNQSPPLYHPEVSPSGQEASSVRPGQFGYGKVPFSLPLHRTNRQARHTANGTDAKLLRRNPFQQEDYANTRAGRPTLSTGGTESHPNTPSRTPRPHRSSLTASVLTGTLSPLLLLLSLTLALRNPTVPRNDDLIRRIPSGANIKRTDSQPRNKTELRSPQKQTVLHFLPHLLNKITMFILLNCLRQLCEIIDLLPSLFCFEVCGGGALDSRAEQCTAFNNQEFMGRLYSWEPFTEAGLEKQCELTCRPVGYRFYVRLAERVRDGTPCFNTSANDVCVEGQCLTEGCDGILGSSAVIDKCGVCGGRDRSCRKVTGSLPNGTVPLGYHKIVDIPPGATFITITERRASPNYLAIRSGTGASVVNGGWAVDAPGDYQAGGTTFTYTQPRAQAEGEEEKGESLRARGPTTTQLQLYIIYQKDNPGVDYEFYVPGSLTVSSENPPPVSDPSLHSLSSSSASSPSFDRWSPDRTRPRGSAPNRNARIPPRTDLPPDTQLPFVWRRGSLTECSATCGRGSQHRVVICVNRHTEEEVTEGNCDSAAKPAAEEESCNTQPCPPFWEASAWSECSVSCGPGVQQRQLQCRQSFGSRSTMVHPQRCAHLTQPDSTQVCQLRLCSHWEVSTNWSTCSVDCGMGRRTRNVRCVSDQGSIVNDNECNSRLRPDGSEECNMGPCVTNWYFTEWSNTCSAQCGPGVQKREVVCLTRGGVRDGGGGGDCVAEKPAELKACNKGPCVPVKMWYSSPWTECNVQCGDGSQRREIICVQKLGSDFTVVPPTECAHLEKPAAVQECSMAECRPQWFTTEWSACSRSCGKGLQVREVRCLTPDKEHSLACDPSTKPEQEQICNTIPCGPQVADKNCRDRRDNCLMVVQARMCVYSYYKMACCASCTQSALRAKRH